MGRVRASSALVYGIALCVLSVVVLWVWVNPLCSVLSGAGAIYYAIVYTMWLKRRTPQNIVIGGGAGAFPPLVGWAAVTGHLGMAAIIMFAVIFFWTPPHFWALALYKNEDYTRAGVPMMPVVRGAAATKVQSVVYAVVLTLTAV
jgi:heme o synthase